MNEQEAFIESVKLNLPLEGKGGLSELNLSRAKAKTNSRIFVDFCVKNEVELSPETTQIPYIKNYIGTLNKSKKKAIEKKKEESQPHYVVDIYANWRYRNAYGRIYLYRRNIEVPMMLMMMSRIKTVQKKAA